VLPPRATTAAAQEEAKAIVDAVGADARGAGE